jgi:hypothetical protein
MMGTTSGTGTAYPSGLPMGFLSENLTFFDQIKEKLIKGLIKYMIYEIM